MQLKMAKAEESIKKHQELKSKIEKEIQTQKIKKALFEDAQNFNPEQERERIRQSLFNDLKAQAD
jgi:hypothetical protein